MTRVIALLRVSPYLEPVSVRELPQLRVLPSPVPTVRPHDRASVEIYRPFFLAGILSVLTAGCLLGAVALAGIALNASYTASAWTPYILAHANSQLYGWVGFFIVGFALQQHAPRIDRAKLFHRLAFATLALFGLGIALRFVAEPLVAVDREVWLPVGIGSCLLQLAGVVLFMVNTTVTRHRGSGPMTWPTILVFASLFWFLAVAIAEPFYFAQSHASDGRDRILFIAQWFPPYREAQFLGFVAMMIFGVALVKLNSCFGARQSDAKLGLAGFGLWTLGLLLRMGGWVSAFNQDLTLESRIPYHLGGVLIGGGALLLILATRIYSKTDYPLPSHKFIRAAFAWLLVSGALMALEPLHLALIGQPFSHAFIGAIRHAATVGFISQMILGVGLRVVSRMNDVPVSVEQPLWATFWLLNLGNAARVGLEIATDYSAGSFVPMGATGFVELVGLSIWGIYLGKLMLGKRRLQVG